MRVLFRREKFGASAALTAVAVILVAGLPAQAETISTYCPAIEMQDRMRSNSFSYEPTPTLVVLGKASMEGEKNLRNGNPTGTLEVEQVLYGHWPSKRLEFAAKWNAIGRMICFLGPAEGDEGPRLHLCYGMDAEEMEAAQALCRARLNTIVLNAHSIFEGVEDEETGESSPGIPKIKVMRVVSGTELKVGETVRLAAHSGLLKISQEPKANPGRRLYFVGARYRLRPDEPEYHPRLSDLPVEVEPAVRAALQRRDDFPIVDKPYGTPGQKVREVTYDGDVAGALRFLSSHDPAVELLAQRYLVLDPEPSREPLTAEIAALLFRTGVTNADEFERHRFRIQTLGQLDRESGSNAVAALVEKVIKHLESSPPTVPMPERDEERLMSRTRDGKRFRIAEELTTDVNHSLAWLLMQMDEADVAQRWAERLITLRGRLEGWWKHEAALAIDVTRIESNRELKSALAKMEKVKPVRSEAGLRHGDGDPIRAVAFSPDGAYLASGNGFVVRVWQTSDWKLVGTLPQGARRLAFSPDATFLYASEGKEPNTLFSRYEWRTARLDKSYSNPSLWIAGMQLSEDGGTMMTASYMDGSLIAWNTSTGDKLRTALLPRISSAAAMSHDGKRMARVMKLSESPKDGPSMSVIEPTDGKGEGLRLLHDFKPSRFAFTRDGRHLIAFGNSDYDKVHLTVHDLDKEGEQVAAITTTGRFANAMATSPDSKLVAVSDEHSRVWLYSLPDLKPLWSIDDGRDGSIFKAGADIAFSPDGKLLAIANTQPTLRLLRLDTFEDVQPFPGHASATRSAYISADNQRLWSFDWDSSLCHWDAATMKSTGRFLAPEGFELKSIREPDGRYALFIKRDLSGDQNKWEMSAKVLDASTGEFVSTTKVAMSPHAILYWLPGEELLIIGNDGNGGITRLNVVTGEVLSFANNDYRLGGTPYLSRDRRFLLWNIDDGYSSLPPTRIDLTTGEASHPKVPGAGPALVVDGVTYERLDHTPEPEKLPVVRGVAVLKSAQSPDGRRLAVVSGQRIYVDQYLRKWDSETPSVIRIHAADTLEMLCAMPTSTPWVEVRFNADGTQLAVTHKDGTIERWDLPK